MGLDQSNVLRRIYNHSPVFVQNLMVSIYGVGWYRRRFGGLFQQEVEQIRERENWPRERLETYCSEQLQQLIRWAYEEVPYYRAVFDRHGIKPKSFRGLEDIENLPLLEKNSIRQDPKSLMARSVSRDRLHKYLTSGTSGTPLEIYWDPVTNQRVSAYLERRCRQWAGVSWKDSRSMIGGRMVVPPTQKGPPYWRYNMIERQLYMSAFHIGASTVVDYVRALNKYKPTYMCGYSSSNYYLARLIQEQGLEVHSPRAFWLSSEKLYDHMRTVLQTVFRTTVFDSYSGVEACCLASECPEKNMHVSLDMGIIEILDPQGKPVPHGMPGEVVATGLLNYAQPLIRYRTGDIAAMSNEYCRCGRGMPLLSGIEGRLEDLVITRDGREMVRFHGLYVGVPHVREGQLIQESLDHFILRIVPDQNFSREDEAILRSRVYERIGPVRVDFIYEKEIERTKRGKFRAVVSKISRDHVVKALGTN